MRQIAIHLLIVSLAIIMPAMSQDANYWLLQAGSDYNNGSYSLALQDITEYLLLNSDDALRWMTKANLEIKLGKYNDALDSFDQAIKLNGSNSQAWNDRALILAGYLNQDEEALDSLNKSLEINPKDANAWYNKGLVLMSQDNCQEALSCFEKAISLDPSNERFLNNKDEALRALGRRPEVKMKFKED